MLRQYTEVGLSGQSIDVPEQFGEDFLVFRNGQLISPREYTYYFSNGLLQFHDSLQVGDQIQIVAP